MSSNRKISISFKSNKIKNMRMIYFKKSWNKRILSNKANKNSKHQGGMKSMKGVKKRMIIIKRC